MGGITNSLGKIMALMAVIVGLRLLCYILLGVRSPLNQAGTEASSRMYKLWGSGWEFH